MPNQFIDQSFRKLILMPLGVAGGAVFGLGVIIVFLYLSMLDSGKATEIAKLATHIGTQLHQAESSERGYLLTGNDEFLQPYKDNVPRLHTQMQHLQQLLAGDADQLRDAVLAEESFRTWHTRVDALIQQQAQGQDVVPIIRQGRGRQLITNIADNLEVIAERQRIRRAEGLKRAGVTLAVLAGGVLIGFIALALAFAIRGRAELQRVAQLKREGEQAFARSNAVLQHQTAMAEAESRVARLFVESGDLVDIGQGLLAMLCQWSGALVGAFYVAAEDGQRFARISGHGIVRQSHAVDGFGVGEGVAGESARTQQAQWLHDVPPNYMPLASQLGDMAPSCVLALPMTGSEGTNAVIELGFLQTPSNDQVMLLERLQVAIGHGIEVSLLRAHAHAHAV